MARPCEGPKGRYGPAVWWQREPRPGNGPSHCARATMQCDFVIAALRSSQLLNLYELVARLSKTCR